MHDMLFEARRVLALVVRHVAITEESRSALRGAVLSLEYEIDRWAADAARRALRGLHEEPTQPGDFEPTQRIRMS
ncbi:MAG TPA: hypothetical protein VKN99_22435 [Polyangia bacterium]|nr:hypothetical protein [Polyangia bacterium]